MPINKAFGVADPQYDALRVQSNQAIYPDAGGAPPGGTGGLENKIYLWHSDGSTIDTFDPDEPGLNAALSGAVATDTVWLPSIPIALTAAVTIPAGVALRGISYNSSLSFSGFSGAAVVLLQDSIIQNFTLNHIDGKGFEAYSAGSKVLDMIITANLPGQAGTSGVTDLWMATRTRLTLVKNISPDDPTFYKIEPNPFSGGKEYKYFGVTYDGTAVYAVDSDNNIWSMDNVAAVRAAPGTAASWTNILATGDATGYGNFNQASGFHVWGTHFIGFTITDTGNQVHCDYSGTAWTFTHPANNYWDYIFGVSQDYVVRSGIVGPTVYRCSLLKDGSTDICFNNVPGETGGGEFVWQNLTDAVAYYMFSRTGDPIGGETTLTVHQRTNSADTLVKSLTHSPSVHPASYARITGAWNDPKAWLTDPNTGELFISANGSIWTGQGSNGTWGTGDGTYADAIMNTSLLGDASFVWIKGTALNGNPFLRFSDDNFATLPTSRSGNYWTDIEPGGVVAFNLINAGLAHL